MTYDIPKDWDKPDFQSDNRWHWTSLVYEDLQEEWCNLSDKHKQIISANLEAIADSELDTYASYND